MTKAILTRVEAELAEMTAIQNEAFAAGDESRAETAAAICQRLYRIESYLQDRMGR
jgi:hypothetical protein